MGTRSDAEPEALQAGAASGLAIARTLLSAAWGEVVPELSAAASPASTSSSVGTATIASMTPTTHLMVLHERLTDAPVA